MPSAVSVSSAAAMTYRASGVGLSKSAGSAVATSPSFRNRRPGSQTVWAGG
ncbi:hypothetical protein ACIGW8_01955 [Streptomyces sioyaensis]|uniref:hypothetical protein n=1 Tax=Streptomyces sioyaensis TaxID=67364 RepID=UPI0037D63535